MGFGVLVIGESGCGKSFSLRNFRCSEIGVFNVVGKPFPFRGELNRCTVNFREDFARGKSKYRVIEESLNKKPLTRRAYVIDDAQYLMAQESFERATDKGYDKFVEMAQHFYRLVSKPQELDDDVIVYFLSHAERDEFGRYRVKTLGKMLQNQLTVEGLFPIVLFARASEDGSYVFETQGISSQSTAKSPFGMFKSQTIDNDLKMVDSAIRDFWGMKPLTDTPKEQKKTEEKTENV